MRAGMGHPIGVVGSRAAHGGRVQSDEAAWKVVSLRSYPRDVQLTSQDISRYDLSMRRVVEPGFTLFVGGSSAGGL